MPSVTGRTAALQRPTSSGSSELRRGAKGQQVVELQQALQRAGMAPGPIDGDFGPSTQAAVRRFQSARGLQVDGVVGPRTWSALRSSAAPSAPASSATLRSGDIGAGVADLQRALERHGYDVGNVDGSFGPATRNAVVQFQRAKGLEADGVAGPNTQRALAGPVTARPPRTINAGGGWGGSEGVAGRAKAIAAQQGLPVTSEKRNLADTIRVGSTTGSDHFTGNTNAYAVDFGVSGSRGDRLARDIAAAYGIPASNIGTYNRHTITVDGQRYSVQLLWRVSGHFDHVHMGIRRA